MLAALGAFGEAGYDGVSVLALARAADTTTGSLYHHFESKLGLYAFVRADVERRVLDRIAGALDTGAAPTTALAAAFDYVRRAGFHRLLAEPHPGGGPDPLAALLREHLAAAPPPLGALLAAAWRAALAASADGADDGDVQRALRALGGEGASLAH